MTTYGSQVSRTCTQSASVAEKRAITWDFSYQKHAAYNAVCRFMCNEACSAPCNQPCYAPCNQPCHTSATQWRGRLAETTTQRECRAASTSASDGEIHAAYKAQVGLGVYDRVFTQSHLRGRSDEQAHRAASKALARFFRVPNEDDVESMDAKVHALIQPALTADTLANRLEKEWSDAGLEIRKPQGGSGFILPCPTSNADRWNGRKHWVESVLADHQVAEHRRMQRVGQLQRRIIVQILASFADSATGQWVAVSHETAARRVLEHLAKQRCRQVSLATVISNVRATWATLHDTGWAKLRAVGRYLTAGERVVASARFGAESQTRAASVRDLIVPRRARPSADSSQSAPTRPAWASLGNPFVIERRRQAGEKAWESLVSLWGKAPLLHTYLAVGQQPVKLLVSRWLLTRGRASDPTCPTKSKTGHRRKNGNAGRPAPSLEAQRLAAELVRAMGWLTRRRGGRRTHMWTLARAVEASGVLSLGLKPRDVLGFWNDMLAFHRQEIHSGQVINPVGWVQACLSNLAGNPQALP